jgi:hypothetical protein
MATLSLDTDQMPVVRSVAEFDRSSGNLLERLVFNNRLAIVAVCALLTVALGYFAATRLVLNASFEKMIPQSQSYIQNYLTYQKDLRGWATRFASSSRTKTATSSTLNISRRSSRSTTSSF